MICLVYGLQRAWCMQAIETMGNQAENSMRSVARLMRYLGVVLVQDALELAEKFPNNPVHQALLVNSDYQ